MVIIIWPSRDEVRSVDMDDDGNNNIMLVGQGWLVVDFFSLSFWSF